MAMTTAGNVGPFQAGANTAIQDSMWQRVMPLMFRDGVAANYLNKLNVTAGTGLQILVDTGLAFAIGEWCYNDASFAINLAAADPTNPRIDNIVVHVNRTNATDSAGVAAYSANMVALTGTPAGSPSPPALTNNANTWEIQLNWVRVNANATVPSTFTDVRVYTPNFPIVYQQLGVGLNGSCGGQATATATNQVWGWWAPFGPTMTNPPTSMTLATITATNAGTQTASSFQKTGFLFTANAPLAQLIVATDTWLSVGNTLLDVGPGSFDIHCDGCEQDASLRKFAVKRGRSLKGDLKVLDDPQWYGSEPGKMALRYECPDCGQVECFNTALSSFDEMLHLPGWEQRMRDAYFIRQMQDQLKVPMLA